MSKLNPGGSRKTFGRIFGAASISAYIMQAIKGRDYAFKSRGSIATTNRHTGQPHEHKREIARRAKRGW